MCKLWAARAWAHASENREQHCSRMRSDSGSRRRDLRSQNARGYPRQRGRSCAWCSCTSPSHSTPARHRASRVEEGIDQDCSRPSASAAQYLHSRETTLALRVWRLPPPPPPLTPHASWTVGRKDPGPVRLLVLANTPPRLICSPCQPTSRRTVTGPSCHLL